MKKPTLDKIIDDYRTLCCNSESNRKGTHNYRCSKCGDDVTYDFYLTVEVQID